MFSARFALVAVLALLGMLSGARAACAGNATRAEKPAEGMRCCFDDLVLASGVTASGMFCTPGQWVRPKSACTILKDGKQVGSTPCCKSGSNDKCDGKFLIECSSSKGTVSTNYSNCAVSTSKGTVATNTTNTTNKKAVASYGSVTGAGSCSFLLMAGFVGTHVM